MPNKLKIHWLAQFSDGSQIKQFNNGKENLFRGVLNRQNDLVKFILFHTEKSLRLTLDLKLGVIYINNTQMPQPELLSNVDDRNSKRLIYFRRWKREIGQMGQKIRADVIYFLGYQGNKNSNSNKYRLQKRKLTNIFMIDKRSPIFSRFPIFADFFKSALFFIKKKWFFIAKSGVSSVHDFDSGYLFSMNSQNSVPNPLS